MNIMSTVMILLNSLFLIGLFAFTAYSAYFLSRKKIPFDRHTKTNMCFIITFMITSSMNILYNLDLMYIPRIYFIYLFLFIVVYITILYSVLDHIELYDKKLVKYPILFLISYIALLVLQFIVSIIREFLK